MLKLFSVQIDRKIVVARIRLLICHFLRHILLLESFFPNQIETSMFNCAVEIGLQAPLHPPFFPVLPYPEKNILYCTFCICHSAQISQCEAQKSFIIPFKNQTKCQPVTTSDLRNPIALQALLFRPEEPRGGQECAPATR